MSFYHAFYRELSARAGGNPIDNRNTVYSGFGPVTELNDAVPRYAANPQALAYVLRNYSPTGEIVDPVLAVHTTYDPGVPPGLSGFYSTATTLKESQELFVQKYVEADGHCNIAPILVGKAFDQLRGWAARGVRPQPGRLR